MPSSPTVAGPGTNHSCDSFLKQQTGPKAEPDLYDLVIPGLLQSKGQLLPTAEQTEAGDL